MSGQIPLLDTPVDGREIRLRCRRPDGEWVTLKALTYRNALDRLPAGWTFVGVAVADLRAAEAWSEKQGAASSLAAGPAEEDKPGE